MSSYLGCDEVRDDVGRSLTSIATADRDGAGPFLPRLPCPSPALLPVLAFNALNPTDESGFLCTENEEGKAASATVTDFRADSSFRALCIGALLEETFSVSILFGGDIKVDLDLSTG